MKDKEIVIGKTQNVDWPRYKGDKIAWKELADKTDQLQKLVEEEALSLRDQGINLTHNNIQNIRQIKGGSGFYGGVHHFYPGGWNALMRKLNPEDEARDYIVMCNYKNEQVGQIFAKSQSEGANILGDFVIGKKEFDEVVPFLITKVNKTGIYLKNNASRIGTKRIHCYLDQQTKKFVQNGGEILAIPQRYKDKYEWIDFFKIDEQSSVELSDPTESNRIRRDKYVVGKTGWFGYARALTVDYLTAESDVNPEDLLEFETTFNQYTTRGRSICVIGLGTYNGIVLNTIVPALYTAKSNTVHIVPGFDKERGYTWLDGFIEDDTGEKRKAFTKRIFYGNSVIYSWRGPENQMLLDYLEGDLPLDKTKPLVINNTNALILGKGKNGEVRLTIPEKIHNKPGILKIVSQGDDLYEWVEYYFAPANDSKNFEFVHSKRIRRSSNGVKLDGLWFGPKIQRYIDFLDQKIEFSHLETIQPTRIRPNAIDLFRYKNKSLALSFAHMDIDLRAPGTQISLIPQNQDENLVLFAKVKNNNFELEKKFIYDQKRNAFRVLTNGKVRGEQLHLTPPGLNEEDIKMLKDLTALFGSSRVVDILYTIRPEFKGIPVDTVQGILSEYLGDFLLQKRSLSISDIETGVGYLSNPDFAEALYEVMKDDCLEFLLKSRKEKPGLSAWQGVEAYFSSLVSKTRHLNSAELDSVINRVVSYYESVVTIPRPFRFVDSLRDGRDFPDINQQVNIQEIEDKKRMLIADRMGLGKSASALMSKELLGIDQALVVVPSNVISTWLKYLSDGPEGYYKHGQAPSVLVVEGSADFNTDLSHYEFIIISHEKLNARYANHLLALDYRMLITDEVHKLKNLVDGVRASHIVDLANKIESEDSYLVLLSGTPVPNKIRDIAISLKLLYPDKFKDIDDAELVRSIISGDIVDLRSLLIPRMQRKTSVEGLNLPDLHEEIIYTDLSDYERAVYQILLEEDEISATDKLRVLRQFVLNPNALDIVPASVNSKARFLGNLLRKDFKTKKRVSLFVNGYINGIVRGEQTVFDELNLPDNVQLRIIDGKNPEERDAIQDEFNSATYPILLVISGQTADVGRDFSGSQANYFFNEPWTEYDRQQQLHRAYREGLKDDLISRTLITKGTIEEGIHWYIQAKYTAVEKLLSGVPLRELEKRLLAKSEDQPEGGLEVNPELAEYYFSTWDRMMKFFAHAKEMGEQEFKQFLTEYGQEYAQNYIDLENRSYYANTNRVVGTLLSSFVQNNAQAPQSTKILDLASGPEVLRKHMPDEYQNSVTSIDINQNHFLDSNPTKKIVGSFLALPFREESFDYATLSLAWHYTSYLLSQKNYERLEVLLEANRVLKNGGRLVISNIYSLSLRDEKAFATVVNALGFKIVQDLTGEVSGGTNFSARMYTLEKINNIGSLSIDEIVANLDRDTLYGIKFKKLDTKIRDSRKMINHFLLNGNLFSINLNQHDQQLYLEEQQIYSEAEVLKNTYGIFEKIPSHVILENGFGRVRIGKHYRLFKGLSSSSGIVVVK